MSLTRNNFSSKSSYQADSDQLTSTSCGYEKPELMKINVKSDSIQGGKYNTTGGGESINMSGGAMNIVYGPS